DVPTRWTRVTSGCASWTRRTAATSSSTVGNASASGWTLRASSTRWDVGIVTLCPSLLRTFAVLPCSVDDDLVELDLVEADDHVGDVAAVRVDVLGVEQRDDREVLDDPLLGRFVQLGGLVQRRRGV